MYCIHIHIQSPNHVKICILSVHYALIYTCILPHMYTQTLNRHVQTYVCKHAEKGPEGYTGILFWMLKQCR